MPTKKKPKQEQKQPPQSEVNQIMGAGIVGITKEIGMVAGALIEQQTNKDGQICPQTMERLRILHQLSKSIEAIETRAKLLQNFR